MKSTITRGSQYKVESVLCRTTNLCNYLLLSAFPQLLKNQTPLRYVPFICEPSKGIYYSPTLVFDFQSLYPSVIIAYNICYSTCLGSVEPNGIYSKDYKYDAKIFYKNKQLTNINNVLYYTLDYSNFGVYKIKKCSVLLLERSLKDNCVIEYNDNLELILLNYTQFRKNEKKINQLNNANYNFTIVKIEKIIKFVKDNTIITPNGIIFVRSNIKKGILPIILEEIILTRILIKNSIRRMKTALKNKSNSYHACNLNNLQNTIDVYENKQIALKLFANVIYGYTSAGFSGRMPCTEIADSIISMGKKLLLQSIEIIRNLTYIGLEKDIFKYVKLKFLYGDTDSIFVNASNINIVDSFKLGNYLSNLITECFPDPIKLQFEKVYSPLILLSKKRYVGFKYSSLQEYKYYIHNKNIYSFSTQTNNSTIMNNLIKKTKFQYFESNYREFLKYLTLFFNNNDNLYITKNYKFSSFNSNLLPTLDSKGIETIRRDTCFFASILLENTIKLLFETKNISNVFLYLKDKLQNMYNNKVNIWNFIISREVKFGKYKNTNVLPYSAYVAYNKHIEDINFLPFYGERIGFIIVNSINKNNLDNSISNRSINYSQNTIINKHSVKDYLLYFKDFNILKNCVNYNLYLKNFIYPPMNRIFNFYNIDVSRWIIYMNIKLNNYIDYIKKLLYNNTLKIENKKLIKENCSKCLGFNYNFLEHRLKGKQINNNYIHVFKEIKNNNVSQNIHLKNHNLLINDSKTQSIMFESIKTKSQLICKNCFCEINRLIYENIN